MRFAMQDMGNSHRNFGGKLVQGWKRRREPAARTPRSPAYASPLGSPAPCMRLLLASLLLLTSCGEATFQPPAGHALVVVTNAAGTPIANASTWWLPAGAMTNRMWLSGCDSSIRDHSFEVLRRHGHARTSDSNGLVAAPPGAWVAAEAGELAGVTRVPDPLPSTASALPLAIDDWHWVVRTVDSEGAPLPGVLIGARPSLSLYDPTIHVVLGQTDATGRLVVRAPGSIDLEASERGRAQEKGERHVESPSAIVVAEGLGVREEQTIRLTPRRSVEVTLTLRWFQRVEFTTPADLWPRGLLAGTRRYRAVTTEAADKSVLYSRPGFNMTLYGTQWTWPQPALGDPDAPDDGGLFQVTLPMPPQVAVLRARLLANDGAAADRSQFLLERAKEQPQDLASSQPDGTIIVWLNTEKPMPSTMRVEVVSSVAPERIGQHTTLVLPKLTAGQRVHLGTQTLSRP